MVEGPGDRLDVAARPGRQHRVEILCHILRLADRPFEQVALRLFGQRVGKAELLDIAFELANRLALGGEGIAEDRFDSLAALEAHVVELVSEQDESGGRPGEKARLLIADMILVGSLSSMIVSRTSCCDPSTA